MKKCSKCKEEKSSEKFRRDASRADGLAYICKVCANAKQREYTARSSAKINARRRAVYNGEAQANARTTGERSYERMLEYRRNYYVNNLAAIKVRVKRHIAANLPYYARNCAKRRATKLRATPAWADQDAIRNIYIEAAYLQMEVDHIVPLQSKFVCGLHNEFNLQALPVSENRSKGNRHWPDMAEEI